jgi:hypothetical protein
VLGPSTQGPSVVAGDKYSRPMKRQRCGVAAARRRQRQLIAAKTCSQTYLQSRRFGGGLHVSREDPRRPTKEHKEDSLLSTMRYIVAKRSTVQDDPWRLKGAVEVKCRDTRLPKHRESCRLSRHNFSVTYDWRRPLTELLPLIRTPSYPGVQLLLPPI